MLTDDTLTVLSKLLFRAGAALPFLRAPIEQMARVPDDAVDGLATDGLSLFYGPNAAPDGPAVAHLLMHCLFRHPVAPEGVIRPLWDLACDVSAEYLRGEFFPSGEANLVRREIAEALPEDVDPRAAGAVYRALMDLFEDELAPLQARFRRDDHRYWYAPPYRTSASPYRTSFASPYRTSFASPPQFRDDGWVAPENRAGEAPSGRHDGHGAHASTYAQWLSEALEQRWPAPDALPGGTVRTGRHGLAPGSREERMVLRAEGKYDFSRYLRRFATTREELRLDLASFDPIPYYYGLRRFGNMPLIEPMEVTESFKVESLVIAIDTSGSCTRPIVQRFLAEIERMLRSEASPSGLCHDSFFSDMEIHIVQCDAIVQSHVVIHSVEAWKKYAKDLVIRGRGGTNFTPVFDLVEKLRRGGALKRLKGLIYFTDGDGVYPRKPTPYETAFVFATRKALGYSLPDWIVPLCLEGEKEGPIQ